MFEHGNFKLSTRGNIVVAELSGAFNEQAATHLIDELKRLCTRFPQGFYFLELAQQFGGATPEVFDMANEFTNWLINNGCLARALVFPEGVQIEITKHFESHLFEGKLNTKRFQDEEQALAWLESIKLSSD